MNEAPITKEIKTRGAPPDFYKRLGAKRGDTKEQINAAYINARKKLNAEATPHEVDARKALHELGEAWDVLGNESERKDYDSRQGKWAPEWWEDYVIVPTNNGTPPEKFVGRAKVRRSREDLHRRKSDDERRGKPDLYGYLGVEHDASRDDILRAHKKITEELSPSADSDPDAKEKLKKATFARNVLTHEDARERYDKNKREWDPRHWQDQTQEPPGWFERYFAEKAYEGGVVSDLLVTAIQRRRAKKASERRQANKTRPPSRRPKS